MVNLHVLEPLGGRGVNLHVLEPLDLPQRAVPRNERGPLILRGGSPLGVSFCHPNEGGWVGVGP
jgi:hypothetical protein